MSPSSLLTVTPHVMPVVQFVRFLDRPIDILSLMITTKTLAHHDVSWRLIFQLVQARDLDLNFYGASDRDLLKPLKLNAGEHWKITASNTLRDWHHLSCLSKLTSTLRSYSLPDGTRTVFGVSYQSVFNLCKTDPTLEQRVLSQGMTNEVVACCLELQLKQLKKESVPTFENDQTVSPNIVIDTNVDVHDLVSQCFDSFGKYTEERKPRVYQYKIMPFETDQKYKNHMRQISTHIKQLTMRFPNTRVINHKGNSGLCQFFDAVLDETTILDHWTTIINEQFILCFWKVDTILYS